MNKRKIQIIDRVRENYLNELERHRYIQSFKEISGDKELLNLAQEGMSDFNEIIIHWDEKKET